MKKSHVIGLLIIMLFGAAKLNFEQKLTEEHRAAFFHNAKIDLSLSQKLGQMASLAALSGFRAVVADFLWIEGHMAWAQTEWSRMAVLFRNVVTLQPRNMMFWDGFAWHMGYNASIAAFNDRLHEPDQEKRIATQHQYWKAAEDIYLEGIENNPDHYYLYEELADLYRDKTQDHMKAFEYYDKAAQFPDAPVYEKRMAAYQLSFVPGKEREAYDRLMKIYKMGKREWVVELFIRLNYLEDKLNIPPAQRVHNPDEKQ